MSDYRFTGTRLVRDGGETTITNGDVVEATESELDAFGDLFEPVGTADGDDADTTSEEPEASEPEPPFDPTELTVATLRNNLDENEYSSAALDALESAERAGEERSTALNAIADARSD